MINTTTDKLFKYSFLIFDGEGFIITEIDNVESIWILPLYFSKVVRMHFHGSSIAG